MLKRSLGISLGMVCVMAGGAHAAIFGMIKLDSSKPWEMKHFTSYAFARDARAQAGDFSVAVTSLKMVKECKFDNGMPLDIGVDFNHYLLGDATAVDLPSSLQSKGLTAGVKFPMPFVEGDVWFMGVSTGAYFQTVKDYAFPSSTFRSKNRVYGIYKPSDDLIIVGGVGYNTDYEDQDLVPLIGIKYQFNERWALNALSLNPNLSYQVNEKTELRLEGMIYSDEFEVTEGARKGDIVSISDYRVGLGVTHEFSEGLKAGLSAGLSLGGTYEYLQNGGKVAVDDGIYVAYNVSWKF